MTDLQDWYNVALSCVHCRVCTSSDIHLTGDENLPICPKGNIFKFESFFACGALEIVRALCEGEITENSPRLQQIIYSCTMCGYCSYHCEMYSSPGSKVKKMGKTFVNIWQDLRADMMERGWGPMEAHNAILKNIANTDNAWGGTRADRERWAKGLGAKDLNKEKADVLYFAGCTATYDPNLKGMMTTAAEVFNKAGVSWGILGKNEKCCAGPSLRVGDRDQFKAYALENVEMFKKSGVKTVVTSCAGCYSTFKKEYPEVADMEGIEVLHVTEFIAQLIKDKKLTFTKEVPLNVTYHDPCHIGRYCNVFDAPRRILRAVPGVSVHEMIQNRNNSWCCGAGAGMRTALPDVASETGIHRVKQAEDTGADVLVSACPFCAQNLIDCIKESGSDLKFRDITEILAQAL